MTNRIEALQGTAEEQVVRLTGQGRLGRAANEQPLPAFTLPGDKDQAKAQEVSRRNHILKALQRVDEASLPKWEGVASIIKGLHKQASKD